MHRRSKVAMRIPEIVLLALASVVGACGGGGGEAAGEQPDAGGAADFTELIGASWELAPGATDTYYCARLTLQEEVVVTGFRAEAPLGTHHTFLSLSPPGGGGGPDGAFPCQVFTGLASGETLIFGSGVGSDDFLFPEGVGVKIEAGRTLILNLHLYNASDHPLSGTSGTLIRTAAAEELEELAEMIVAGTVDFAIPPTGQPHSATTTCTFSNDATLLNVWPHMHQLGAHMKVVHEGEVLHDQPYSFEEQKNWPLVRAIKAGDQLEVTCTWINDTDQTVTFGDSSDQEMCFVGFYRYPLATAIDGCDLL